MKITKAAFRLPHWVVTAGLLLPLVAQAATVTGTVTNKTTNRPDAGDDVVLVAFGKGMQEAARTKTDAKGHYSIALPDNNMHLIRVDHEKAAYFEPVPPGTTHVDVDVYDVLAKVPGVRTEADVMRMETDPQGLHVIENYFVRNQSTPPRTQFSARAYEIDLPADAQIEASAAMGPQGMPVASSPMPAGPKGHYAFVFPIRPGETRFQLSYHVPYSGKFTFTPQMAMRTDNLAIMMPPSMTFTPAAAGVFQAIKDNVQAQTYVAKNPAPGETLAFTVSGTGAMPREAQDQAGAAGPEQGNAAAAPEGRPGGGLGVPIDTPDPLQKYKWWILSGLALVLVVAAAFLLRGKPALSVEPQKETAASPLTPTVAIPRTTAGAAAGATAVANPAGLLNSLKEELFALETERVEGKLNEQEYADTKAALEVVLRRALARRT